MDAANDKAFMDEVAAGLRAFGMAYDEENDLFVYHEPGVLAFTVTLHSLVSTVVHDREKLEKLAEVMDTDILILDGSLEMYRELLELKDSEHIIRLEPGTPVTLDMFR